MKERVVWRESSKKIKKQNSGRQQRKMMSARLMLLKSNFTARFSSSTTLSFLSIFISVDYEALSFFFVGSRRKKIKDL